MRSGSWVLTWLLTALLAFQACAATAAPVLLRQGEPAPEDGLFLPGADATKLSTVLKGTPFEQQEAAILDGLVASQQKQINELTAALNACKTMGEAQQQIAIARQDIAKEYLTMLAAYKQLLADARVQFDKDSKTIVALQDRIKELEKRGFWTYVIGVLTTVLIGFFGPGAALLFK